MVSEDGVYHGDMQQRISQTITFADFLAPATGGPAPAQQQLYLAQVGETIIHTSGHGNLSAHGHVDPGSIV